MARYSVSLISRNYNLKIPNYHNIFIRIAKISKSDQVKL